MRKIKLFGVGIDNINKSQALTLVIHWLNQWQKTSDTSDTFPKLVFTPNPEMIVAAQKDSEFNKALNHADLSIADGSGLKLADRRLKIIHGIDLMESLIKSAAKNNWRVVLLGGRPGVAAAAAAKLKINNCKLKIYGLSASQNIAHASKAETNSVISYINHFRPHLLFVAFGHGKQEKWLIANRRRLKAAVAMGVGGSLDQIADPSLRPPQYINSIRLGWLYRLIRQPWRWKRQLALLKFAGMAIKEKIQSYSDFKLPLDKQG